MLNFTFIKPVYAAVCNTLLDPGCTTNPDPFVRTGNVIQTIISWLLLVAVLFFLFNFLFAAYNYISSGGDAKKIEAARDAIINAVLGLSLAFIVFVFLKLFGLVFGIPNLDSLHLALPTL